MQAGLARDQLRFRPAGDSFGDDASPSPRTRKGVGPRIECTLSQLGVVQRTLVAFGGHWPDGELATGGPLISDAVSQQWSAMSSTPIHDVHVACPRTSHAAAVMGENRSLLIICGGEGEWGGLLDDLKLLEMRSTSTAIQADQRRRDQAERAGIYEELSAMREKVLPTQQPALHQPCYHTKPELHLDLPGFRTSEWASSEPAQIR
jgi:hypothetical protein